MQRKGFIFLGAYSAPVGQAAMGVFLHHLGHPSSMLGLSGSRSASRISGVEPGSASHAVAGVSKTVFAIGDDPGPGSGHSGREFIVEPYTQTLIFEEFYEIHNPLMLGPMLFALVHLVAAAYDPQHLRRKSPAVVIPDKDNHRSGPIMLCPGLRPAAY